MLNLRAEYITLKGPIHQVTESQTLKFMSQKATLKRCPVVLLSLKK